MPMSTHISHVTDSSPYVVGSSIVDFTHWSCIGTGNRTTLYFRLLALPSAVRVTCGFCESKPHTKIGLIDAWINFTGLSSMPRIMQIVCICHDRDVFELSGHIPKSSYEWIHGCGKCVMNGADWQIVCQFAYMVWSLGMAYVRSKKIVTWSRFKIKMSYYQNWKYHCGDKTSKR